MCSANGRCSGMKTVENAAVAMLAPLDYKQTNSSKPLFIITELYPENKNGICALRLV